MAKTRGLIHSRERACQQIDYRGLRYGKITPTDVDGMLDFGGEVFVMLEYKVQGVEMPDGQRIAYEHIIDALWKAGKVAICLVAEHRTLPHEDIKSAAADVVLFRWHGEWREPHKRPMQVWQAIDNILTDYAPRYLE